MKGQFFTIVGLVSALLSASPAGAQTATVPSDAEIRPFSSIASTFRSRRRDCRRRD